MSLTDTHFDDFDDNHNNLQPARPMMRSASAGWPEPSIALYGLDHAADPYWPPSASNSTAQRNTDWLASAVGPTPPSQGHGGSVNGWPSAFGAGGLAGGRAAAQPYASYSMPSSPLVASQHALASSSSGPVYDEHELAREMERQQTRGQRGGGATRLNGLAMQAREEAKPRSMRQDVPPFYRTMSSPGAFLSDSEDGYDDRSPSQRPRDRDSRGRALNPEDSKRASLYKTELCRSFEETGSCRYGNKCQFAHGQAELRARSQHPRYRTEVCKTFHTVGTCPYGKRCRFIHLEGLPPYWSPSSPLSYLLPQDDADHPADVGSPKFDLNEYFGTLRDGDPMPFNPLGLSSEIRNADGASSSPSGKQTHVHEHSGEGPDDHSDTSTASTGSDEEADFHGQHPPPQQQHGHPQQAPPQLRSTGPHQQQQQSSHRMAASSLRLPPTLAPRAAHMQYLSMGHASAPVSPQASPRMPSQAKASGPSMMRSASSDLADWKHDAENDVPGRRLPIFRIIESTSAGQPNQHRRAQRPPPSSASWGAAPAHHRDASPKLPAASAVPRSRSLLSEQTTYDDQDGTDSPLGLDEERALAALHLGDLLN